MRPNLSKVPALQKIDVRDSVVLRPLEAADAAALLAVIDADPTIRERVGVATGLHNVQDVVRLVEQEKDDPELIRYVLCEKGVVVGLINLWRAGEFFAEKADPDDYGFGYFLAPSARGRGLVTDGLSALMTVATKHLPVKRFIAFCEADNTASGAVLQKAGFEKTHVQWQDNDHGWTEQKYSREVLKP